MNIELLKTMGTVRQFRKGDFICVENEEGTTAYLLLRGKVTITLASFADPIRNVVRLEVGTIFGEMSLLENKPRNASVIADADDTLVLEISKENFLDFIQYDHEAAWNLLCTLLKRMENLTYRQHLKEFVQIAGYHKNNFYIQIKSLSKEQFKGIIEQDCTYALQLLKFLSRALAEFNDELVRRESK
jgi:CRP-like cAMP-binding protein